MKTMDYHIGYTPDEQTVWARTKGIGDTEIDTARAAELALQLNMPATAYTEKGFVFVTPDVAANLAATTLSVDA